MARLATVMACDALVSASRALEGTKEELRVAVRSRVLANVRGEDAPRVVGRRLASGDGLYRNESIPRRLRDMRILVGSDQSHPYVAAPRLGAFQTVCEHLESTMF